MRFTMYRSQRAWRCCIAGASADDKVRAATMSSNATLSPADCSSLELEEVLLELLLLLLLLLLLVINELAIVSSTLSKSGMVSEYTNCTRPPSARPVTLPTWIVCHDEAVPSPAFAGGDSMGDAMPLGERRCRFEAWAEEENCCCWCC